MPTACFRSLFIIFILAWILPHTSIAQEEGTEDAQQLPEIAPREIEVRGELQLSFPSLKRQPLDGFASPPTIPSVPPDRTPYAASYKQALDDLPESLPAPETVSQPVTTPTSPSRGLIEMGMGRYVSRFAKGHFTVPLTDRQTLGVRADYTGTDGFTPFSRDEVETPADDFEGRVRFDSRHEGFSLGMNLNGSADRYELYGIPSVVTDTAASAPDRDAFSIGPALEFRTHGSVKSSVRIGYDYTRYETQLDPTDDASTTTFREGRFEFDGSASFPVYGKDTDLSFSWSRSSLGGDEPSNTAYSIDAGATVQVVDTEQLSVRAGGRYLGFDAPVNSRRSDPRSATASFILPQAEAVFTPYTNVTFYAKNTPGLTRGSLANLYANNPYARHAPSVRPTLFTTDAETGANLTIGLFRFQTTAGFRYAPSYRHFAAPRVEGPRSGTFRVGYDAARIFHGGAEVALQGVSGVEASVGVSFRDGSLVDEDGTEIPYFSPVVADAMVSVSFAEQKGHLQTTGTIESPRPVNRLDNDEVRTYVSFDVEGSYQITPLLDGVVRVENVGPRSPKRFARYPQPPASIMVGFRINL